MTFNEFVTKHPELVTKFPNATVRKWKQRDKVPDSVTSDVAAALERDKAQQACTHDWHVEDHPDGYMRRICQDCGKSMKARYKCNLDHYDANTNVAIVTLEEAERARQNKKTLAETRV